ncbi:MAG: hypothetical protein RLN62_05600 [Rickettsiales bacterium]
MKKDLKHIIGEHKIIHDRSVQTLKHYTNHSTHRIQRDVERQVGLLNRDLDELRAQFNEKIAAKTKSKNTEDA